MKDVLYKDRSFTDPLHGDDARDATSPLRAHTNNHVGSKVAQDKLSPDTSVSSSIVDISYTAETDNEEDGGGNEEDSPTKNTGLDSSRLAVPTVQAGCTKTHTVQGVTAVGHSRKEVCLLCQDFYFILTTNTFIYYPLALFIGYPWGANNSNASQQGQISWRSSAFS